MEDKNEVNAIDVEFIGTVFNIANSPSNSVSGASITGNMPNVGGFTRSLTQDSERPHIADRCLAEELLMGAILERNVSWRVVKDEKEGDAAREKETED